MSAIDAGFKELMDIPEVFASLFNVFLFKEKTLIEADSLISLDVEGKASSTTSEKTVTTFRDKLVRGICKMGKECVCTLLGLEEQSFFDISMSARSMRYDALNICNEFKKLQDENMKKRAKKLKGDSFLSKLLPGDRVKPVFTLVVYLSDKEWPLEFRSIRGLFDVGMLLQEFTHLLPNYEMNLLVPCELTDEEIMRFHPALAAVLFTAKFRSNKGKLFELIQVNEVFRDLDYRAANLVNLLGRWNLIFPYSKENVNMKEETMSFREWFIEEGIAIGEKRGERRGEKRGKRQERENGIRRTVLALRNVGCNAETISSQIVSVYGLTSSQADAYVAEVSQ